jgi:hypothetical protein
MAERYFIIPRRNDFDGANVQVLDLFPNTSQKNGALDGQGQTFYVGRVDAPGVTLRDGDAYRSGSLMTALAAADEAVLDDTTGGGNDCLATPTACFGLAAYLVERCQRAGAAGGHLTPANANAMVLALMVRANAGLALDLAGINAVLAGVVAGTELTTAGGSLSFGTVVEVLAILSGMVYRVPRHVIITNAANLFLDQAGRQALVDAQDYANNGGVTFSVQGDFLSNTESGFQARPDLAPSGYMTASVHAGNLHALAADVTFVNPAYAYAAADVTPYRPRAYTLGGAAIPATGTAHGIHVYLDDGICLI